MPINEKMRIETKHDRNIRTSRNKAYLNDRFLSKSTSPAIAQQTTVSINMIIKILSAFALGKNKDITIGIDKIIPPNAPYTMLLFINDTSPYISCIHTLSYKYLQDHQSKITNYVEHQILLIGLYQHPSKGGNH